MGKWLDGVVVRYDTVTNMDRDKGWSCDDVCYNYDTPIYICTRQKLGF